MTFVEIVGHLNFILGLLKIGLPDLLLARTGIDWTTNSQGTVVKRLICFSLIVSLLCCPSLIADEPAEKFLKALRENGYYDVALEYLESIKQSDLVSPDFRREVPFERAKVLIRSTRDLRDRDEINSRLDQAQGLLTEYASNDQSLKVSGKTLRFQGNLLYLRASSQLRQAESDRLTAAEKETFRVTARGLLKQSLDAYTQSRTLIRRLIDPKSNDVIVQDPEDPSTIEELKYFQNLYADVRVALPLVAERLGDTYTPGSPNYRKELQNAAKEYTDVFEDYRKYLSGLRACVYAARCNQNWATTRNPWIFSPIFLIWETTRPSSHSNWKLMFWRQNAGAVWTPIRSTMLSTCWNQPSRY